MTNVNELKEALKETLEERGELNKIRAMMRAAIFESIETDDKPKPKLSDENLIINELIREYLKYNYNNITYHRYNNYLHSTSVFIAESGQPVDSPFDRNFIAKELNIKEDNTSKKVPLLYSILFGLKNEVYEPTQSINNNNIQYDNLNSNNFFVSNQNISNIRNDNINNRAQVITTSVNKLKDQSVNLNNSVRGSNSIYPEGKYLNSKEQPKPWIID